MTPTRSPLHWPADWKRLNYAYRRDAKFSKYGKDLTVFEGVQRVLAELKRLGIDEQDVIVSTNIRTRLDGLPRTGEPKPSDPGAAVYWQPRGDKPMRCMAVDAYTEVADNLAAIAATLDAMRAIERHGGASILDRAFTGFTALPAPDSATWFDVLAVPQSASADDVRAAWQRLRSRWHPDKPDGNAARFDIINKAYDQFKESYE